jgi:hypothetical protein
MRELNRRSFLLGSTAMAGFGLGNAMPMIRPLAGISSPAAAGLETYWRIFAAVIPAIPVREIGTPTLRIEASLKAMAWYEIEGMDASGFNLTVAPGRISGGFE